MKRSTIFCLAVSLSGGALSAQNSIQGPTVGWIWDADNHALRAILGIPGSSVLGAPYDAGFPQRAAVTSDSGDMALLLNADDQSVYVMPLRDGTGPRRLAVPVGVSQAWLSPRGMSAALRYDAANKIVVVRNLTGTPEVAAELDVSNEGMPDVLAVADDASGILALYKQKNAAMAFRADGNRWKLDGMDGLRSAAFFENSQDLLVAGLQGTVVISGVFGEARMERVREGSAIAAAPGSNRGIAVVLEEAGLVALNLTDATVQNIDCACAPSTVVRIANSVFRINDLSDGPLWLAELTASQPRTVFVPADAKSEE